MTASLKKPLAFFERVFLAQWWWQQRLMNTNFNNSSFKKRVEVRTESKLLKCHSHSRCEIAALTGYKASAKEKRLRQRFLKPGSILRNLANHLLLT